MLCGRCEVVSVAHGRNGIKGGDSSQVVVLVSVTDRCICRLQAAAAAAAVSLSCTLDRCLRAHLCDTSFLISFGAQLTCELVESVLKLEMALRSSSSSSFNNAPAVVCAVIESISDCVLAAGASR